MAAIRMVYRVLNSNELKTNWAPRVQKIHPKEINTQNKHQTIHNCANERKIHNDWILLYAVRDNDWERELIWCTLKRDK